MLLWRVILKSSVISTVYVIISLVMLIDEIAESIEFSESLLPAALVSSGYSTESAPLMPTYSLLELPVSVPEAAVLVPF